MPIFCVLRTDEDDYGTTGDRVKTRALADARLAEIAATGCFVRIVKWVGGKPREMIRVNDTVNEGENNGGN